MRFSLFLSAALIMGVGRIEPCNSGLGYVGADTPRAILPARTRLTASGTRPLPWRERFL
jgi:hypothetical protein